MKPQHFGILVAGMHRSGTSAAAGALQHLGVALGDGLLAGADDNPKGYFEHEAVVGVHDELLRELASWWSDPRALPEGWLATPAARRAEERLVAILRHDFAGRPVWAVKDPRACRLLPLWRRCLERLEWTAGVLHVVRSPAEVAASLASRNGFSRPLGELLWLRHVTAAIRDSADLPRTVLLYESLLADPHGAMQRALAALGAELPAQASADSAALEGFVDPAFRHHEKHATVPGNRMSALAGEIFEGYRALAAGKGDWKALEVSCSRFDAEWSAVEPLVGSVAESVFPALDGREALQADLREVQSRLYAQIEWSEKAVVEHAAVAQARDALAAELHVALQSLKDAEAAQSRLQSDLAGQVRWAQEFVAGHEVMRDERDSLVASRDQIQAQLLQSSHELALARAEIVRLQSELAEQVRLAEQTVIGHRATAELHQTQFALLQQANQAQSSLVESLGGQLRAAVEDLDALKVDHARLQAEGQAAKEATDAVRAELARTSDELAQLRASLSWRCTAPLRALRRLAGGHADGDIIESGKEKNP